MTSLLEALKPPTSRLSRPAAVSLGLAVVVGTLAVREPTLGLVVASLPILLLVAVRAPLLAVMGVGALAFPTGVIPGVGVEVSGSDLCFLVATTVLILSSALTGRWPGRDVLRPATPYVLAYAFVLVVVLAEHPSGHSTINAFQRLQLVVFPMLVGAHLLNRRMAHLALGLFIVGALLVGLSYNRDVLPAVLELQKNPLGQYLADALLVLLGTSVGGRWRYLLLVPTALALLLTGSRGALVGLVAGAVVLFLSRAGVNRIRLAAALVPATLVLIAIFQTLPSDDRARLTTYTDTTAGSSTSGEYTIAVRDGYRADAFTIIRAHPLTGLGIGNYVEGTRVAYVTTDPHNVVLLELGEGGFPLAIAYVVLVLGTGLVLVRRRRSTPLAPVALAVQTAIITHGMFDVYWVRGTPELGWLLVGLALAQSRAAAPEKERRRTPRSGDARRGTPLPVLTN